MIRDLCIPYDIQESLSHKVSVNLLALRALPSTSGQHEGSQEKLSQSEVPWTFKSANVRTFIPHAGHHALV